MLTGNICKMMTELTDVVDYFLPLGDEKIPMNSYIGKTLSMQFTGNIHCVHCGRQTKKSFQQGHCYPCFQKLQGCDNCMIFPEKCHAKDGTCDPDDWVHASCMQPHVVYLANSSGLKVGITRTSQMPTRWIDQGAVQALPIFKVSNRYQSGVMESALKKFVNDKTNWRVMLKGSPEPLDLLKEKEWLLELAEKEVDDVLAQFEDGAIEFLPEHEPLTIHFPVEEYPIKVTSFNFDKNPEVSGTLVGIKGQYLIFREGVINVRKFGGYGICFKLSSHP